LVGRQLAEGGAQRLGIGDVIGVGWKVEQIDACLPRRLMGPVSRVSASEVIHSQVVSQPKQEGARNPHPSHPIRVSSQRDEEFLEEIPGVRLISGEV
jgi:hypothetical protein